MSYTLKFLAYPKLRTTDSRCFIGNKISMQMLVIFKLICYGINLNFITIFINTDPFQIVRFLTRQKQGSFINGVYFLIILLKFLSYLYQEKLPNFFFFNNKQFLRFSLLLYAIVKKVNLFFVYHKYPFLLAPGFYMLLSQ